MQRVFSGELRRVLKRSGYVAFEVGEVRRGKLRMEELVTPAAKAAKLKPVIVSINRQEFTKRPIAGASPIKSQERIPIA